MENSFENKLLKVDLLDIYDDIAAIKISPEELAQLCSAFTCRVNLSIGNVVYAVEEKYKNKLVNYKKEKRLKWLRANLNAIMPNPDEKFLNWQQRHNKGKRLDWMRRKILALEYFADEPHLFNSEEPYDSHSLLMTPEGRLSQNIQETFHRDLFNENSNCTSIDNTSVESVQTVIASQPKNTQESFNSADLTPLIDFKDVSRSILSSSSGELPSICSEGTIPPLENETNSNQNGNSKATVRLPDQSKRNILPLLLESEGISSQEDAYDTFCQDRHVTSTQEFG